MQPRTLRLGLALLFAIPPVLEADELALKEYDVVRLAEASTASSGRSRCSIASRATRSSSSTIRMCSSWTRACSRPLAGAWQTKCAS